MLEGTRAIHIAEKAAICKRLAVVLTQCEQYLAFDTFEPLLEMLSVVGAFKDCPTGSAPGSFQSPAASYTSQRSHRTFLHALALAVRSNARIDRRSAAAVSASARRAARSRCSDASASASSSTALE